MSIEQEFRIVGIVLTDEEFAWVERQATERHILPGDVLRDLVDAAMAGPSFGDALAHLHTPVEPEGLHGVEWRLISCASSSGPAVDHNPASGEGVIP